MVANNQDLGADDKIIYCREKRVGFDLLFPYKWEFSNFPRVLYVLKSIQGSFEHLFLGLIIKCLAGHTAKREPDVNSAGRGNLGLTQLAISTGQAYS